MGKDIPVVLGGFGKGKKCISDKTVAEIHGIEIKHVRELIKYNINRFKNEIDYIDLKVVVLDGYNFITNLGYSKMQISKSEHIYLLSERGYAKLIKIMDSDLAWEIHDKLIDEYFVLREIIKSKPDSYMIEDPIERAKRWIEEAEERKRLERENIEMKPKAEFHDAVAASDDTITFDQMAKLLKSHGIPDIGRNRLYADLRQSNILMGNNIPYQIYMDKGWFKIKETTGVTRLGRHFINTQTMITPKGQKEIIKAYQDMASQKERG